MIPIHQNLSLIQSSLNFKNLLSYNDELISALYTKYQDELNTDILEDLNNSSTKLNYKQLMNLVLSSLKDVIFDVEILKLGEDDIKHNEEHKTR